MCCHGNTFLTSTLFFLGMGVPMTTGGGLFKAALLVRVPVSYRAYVTVCTAVTAKRMYCSHSAWYKQVHVYMYNHVQCIIRVHRLMCSVHVCVYIMYLYMYILWVVYYTYTCTCICTCICTHVQCIYEYIHRLMCSVQCTVCVYK